MFKLVSFAHNWNTGMMVLGYWGNGLMLKPLLTEKLINENFLLISISHYSLLKANINVS
jgi:hypothetical protein